MAKVTVINPGARLQPALSLDQAIRESVRARCRDQLETLARDFFDEVDDFLFASGSKGQFAEDASYLKAMRELRTKQNLFIEAFVDITATTVFSNQVGASAGESGYTRHLVDRHAEIYEMLEIDLALHSMQRKAVKFYTSHDQQLEALLERVQFETGKGMQPKFAVVGASLWAFGEAQRVFSLPLEIRLVVIKLFEQHMLLKLETLYKDVINIVKHILGKGARERNRMAPESDRSSETAVTQLQGPPESAADKVTAIARSSTLTIDHAVDAAVAGYVTTPGLPAFVADMLRCKWRTVLFLVGMNRGCFGQDWQEAIGTMRTLVLGTSGQSALAAKDVEELLDKLRHGFALLQTPEKEQSRFVQQVQECLLEHEAATELLGLAGFPEAPQPAASQQVIVPEASLSPSGQKILDQEDLDEISSLFGADDTELSTSAVEQQLLACLPEIDRLREEEVVQYKINGRFHPCSLRKNPTRPGMFTLVERQSRTTINRSRLGLAISLHEGELQLPGVHAPVRASQKTLIEPGTFKSVK